MMRVTLRRLVAAAGILALPGPAGTDPQSTEVTILQADPRLIRIQTYFHRYACPAEELADDFVLAADRHNLDWRLLPAISMIESAGGKGYMNNNIFGWDNCRVRFPTVRAGIYLVAKQLAESEWYRAKRLPDLLRTYNPTPGYGERIQSIMRELGPAALPKARLQ